VDDTQGSLIDFAAVFEVLPQPCAVLSPDLLVLHANAACRALWAATSLGVVGRRVEELLVTGETAVGADGAAAVQASLKRVIEQNRPDAATVATTKRLESAPKREVAEGAGWKVSSTPRLGPHGDVDSIVLVLERVDMPSLMVPLADQAHAIERLREANDRLSAQIDDNRRLETERRSVSDRLQESEMRFRTLANKLPGVVYRRIMGVDGSIRDTYVSDGVERYLGVPAERLMAGELSLLDFVHPDDRARKLQAMKLAASNNMPLTIEVRKLARPDNQVRWWRVHTTPTALAEGAVQWDGIAIDITDQKAAEQQLHHAMKMEAVGQLTGGIAHDFNNLLTIILGNAESLVENLATQPRLRPLAVLTQLAAERGADLTSRLLMFARRQALEPRTVDVNNLVLSIEPLLRRALGEFVELGFSHGTGLWKAFVDPGQFESALLNLALNARDAMPNGGRLMIETANVEIDTDYAQANDMASPGKYVMMAVSDNGCGMPPESIARAFEPFFTTKPFGKGSGLGLSMVFGFMKQSGGHVSIYSELGHGTTVRLYLPRSLAEASPLVLHEGSSAVPLGHEMVLLVEDDEMVRSHIQRMLEGLGYKVLAAPDGPRALSIVEQGGPIDLLLTDVVMPGGLSGKTLAEASLNRRPALKVLFMSGYTENAIVHHGRLDPGVHLLRKPFRRRELAEKLRAVLDSGAPGMPDAWLVE
jgi:PAS domain S-box-containing protein